MHSYYNIEYICYVQSMDLRNPWIVLRKVAIDTLYNKVYMDLLCIPWIVPRYFAQSRYGSRRSDFVLF